MSENRDNEARSWNEDEVHGDKAVADLKRSISRLRGHVGAYRDQMSDNDNAGQSAAMRATARKPRPAG